MALTQFFVPNDYFITWTFTIIAMLRNNEHIFTISQTSIKPSFRLYFQKKDRLAKPKRLGKKWPAGVHIDYYQGNSIFYFKPCMNCYHKGECKYHKNMNETLSMKHQFQAQKWQAQKVN